MPPQNQPRRTPGEATGPSLGGLATALRGMVDTRPMTPGIEPMRPKGFGTPFKPEDFTDQPTISPWNPSQPQEPIPSPEGFTEVPGGFEPGRDIPGHAIWDGPQLNTASALSGLRNAMNPELERIKNAYSIGAGGDAFSPSRGLRDQILGDVGSSLAPQRQAVQATEGALQTQHPAMREFAEQEARRRAYPAEISGEAAIDAADIAARGRVREEAIKAQQAGQEASNLPIDAILKGLTDIGSLRDQDDPNTVQARELFQRLLVQSLLQRGMNASGAR